ncbi:MAG: hypothetical protein E7184_02890 [Erysipelotrichaceae bacterium]|nr:hypothetical protein [Erysipelotrichaceae bacterium]
MPKNNEKVFNEELIQSIATKYSKDFYELSSKKMNIKKATLFSKRFVADLFNVYFEVKDLNKNSNNSSIKGGYNDIMKTIFIDESHFKHIVTSGDLVEFLITTFHEGTHSIQGYDKEEMLHSKEGIYNIDSIKYILKTNNPQFYESLKNDPQFDMKLEATKGLSYLEKPIEKEARETSYINVKNLFSFYKNTFDIKWYENLGNQTPMSNEENRYYFDAMTSFANKEMARIDVVNSAYENFDKYFAFAGDIYKQVLSIVDNLDINKFSDDLIKFHIFKNEFPNLDAIITKSPYDNISQEIFDKNKKTILNFLQKKFINANILKDVNDSTNLQSNIYQDILSKLPDEKLNQIIQNTKNMPFIFNPTNSVYFSIEASKLKKDIFIKLLKEGKGNLLAHDINLFSSAYSMDIIKDALPIALKTGQYEVAEKMHKTLKNKISSSLTLKNYLSLEQTNELIKLLKIEKKIKNQIIKSAKYELSRGFLSKEKSKSLYLGDINSLFDDLLDDYDSDKKFAKSSRELLNEYNKLYQSNIYTSTYNKHKKLGDYSNNAISKDEAFRKYGFHSDKDTAIIKTFLSWLSFPDPEKPVTEEFLTSLYNNVTRDHNDDYTEEIKRDI